MSTRLDKFSRVKNLGWQVTFAGLGINLALGVLYTWSIISSQIDTAGWGWTASDRVLPYSVACLVFCFVMIPAGSMQDKFGPRIVATIGGVLVGMGMILASMFESVTGYVIGFGVLAGAGIGFGYASATPPAVKWFSKSKTGLIAGIVVSGFGMASIYAAPLAKWLADTYSLQVMMMSFGIGFMVIVVGLSQLLISPPEGFAADPEPVPQSAGAAAVEVAENYTPGEMLKTSQFYMLWFMYACGAGAGLMVISMCKKINAKAGVGVLAVMALAIGNGAGRILAGVISDKIGRKMTMFVFFVTQAIVIVAMGVVGGKDIPPAVAMIILSVLVGANYGSNLALFPSATKDYFGMKNFGVNYGMIFTAWGVGGFMLSRFAAGVYDGKYLVAWAGNYNFAFYVSAALLVVAGVMTFIVKSPQRKY